MTAEFYLMVDLNGLADRIRAAEEARRRRLAKHGRRAIVALVDTQGESASALITALQDQPGEAEMMRATNA
jgi:hypothetical protein